MPHASQLFERVLGDIDLIESLFSLTLQREIFISLQVSEKRKYILYIFKETMEKDSDTCTFVYEMVTDERICEATEWMVKKFNEIIKIYTEKFIARRAEEGESDCINAATTTLEYFNKLLKL